MQAGDLRGRLPPEGAAFEGGYGSADRPGSAAPGRGQIDDYHAAITRPHAAGDVATPFETIQHAGQRRGTRTHRREQLGHGPAPPVCHVGERIDLSRRQVQLREVRVQDVLRGVGRALQREQRRRLG